MNEENNKLAKIEGWLSIFLNLVLFALKFIVGISIGSIAIIADAWHTLSDSLSSLVLLVGVKLSEKPADKEHPYGHGRFQLLATFGIGIMLALVGIDFLGRSFKLFSEDTKIVYGVLGISVTVLSILIKEGLAQFSFFAAKKSNSKALKADAWHHRSDALSSLVILVGIFLNNKIPHIDAILGFIVALCILYTSYEIFKDVINSLLGTAPTKKLVEQINMITKEETGWDVSPHHFHIHEYGGHVELTFHIYLPPKLPLRDAHEFADKIEKRISNELNIVATVHFEPDELQKLA
ncbi:MAG: cation diffusion facilitator family transporter [Kiritimatiellae bacterium]|jgi:cation diffusion facilitator family transporter|nr:cation diffusion facilitator family transporter [Kiritimatiellia bacterium]